MNEQNLEDHNNKTIIVDIYIDNCNIRASKPADRFQNNPIPTNNEVQRDIWWESAVQGIFCLSDSPLSR